VPKYIPPGKVRPRPSAPSWKKPIREDSCPPPTLRPSLRPRSGRSPPSHPTGREPRVKLRAEHPPSARGGAAALPHPPAWPVPGPGAGSPGPPSRPPRPAHPPSYHPTPTLPYPEIRGLELFQGNWLGCSRRIGSVNIGVQKGAQGGLGKG